MGLSGDIVFRNSLGSFLCIGVSTIPGVTAFTRMPFFAYYIARLRVMASISVFCNHRDRRINSSDRVLD
jgi:hypothetical protein